MPLCTYTGLRDWYVKYCTKTVGVQSTGMGVQSTGMSIPMWVKKCVQSPRFTPIMDICISIIIVFVMVVSTDAQYYTLLTLLIFLLVIELACYITVYGWTLFRRSGGHTAAAILTCLLVPGMCSTVYIVLCIYSEMCM